MSHRHHADRPMLGILLMLGFCVLAPAGDAVAKSLGGLVPVGQVLLVRFGVQLGLLAPILLAAGGIPRMAPGIWLQVVARTVLHISGIGMMFVALMHLPLADAIAIAFVLPFLMLLLGKLLHGDEVGPRRLGACAVGFFGTLLVVQPAFEHVGWPALLPLGVAVNFAVFMLLTRQVSRAIDPIRLQALSGAIALGLLVPLILLVPETVVPDLRIEAVPAATWGLLLLLGTLGTLAHLLMTWSLKYAPSATLAPMQYLEIPFATLIGYAVFGDFPNGLAMVGICITIAAGLFILQREQAIARARSTAHPSTTPGPTLAAARPATARSRSG